MIPMIASVGVLVVEVIALLAIATFLILLIKVGAAIDSKRDAKEEAGANHVVSERKALGEPADEQPVAVEAVSETKLSEEELNTFNAALSSAEEAARDDLSERYEGHAGDSDAEEVEAFIASLSGKTKEVRDGMFQSYIGKHAQDSSDGLSIFVAYIATVLGDMRDGFFKTYISNIISLGTEWGMNWASRVQQAPTTAGRFLISSFQFWVIWYLLGDREDKFPTVAASQRFTDQMYIQGIGPCYPPHEVDDPIPVDALVNGFTYAKNPIEKFYYLMREVIFTGTFRTDGYDTSLIHMGISIDPASLMGLRTHHDHLTKSLVWGTELIIALAFGETGLAAELERRIDEHNEST